jgi:hypothetical protein
MHEFIKVGYIFNDRASLLNMKVLANEMIKPISIKSRYNMMTEFIPRALMKIDFNSLHPKSSSAFEIDGS